MVVASLTHCRQTQHIRMIRQRLIFILTHGYPLFIAVHLYFGDWCRTCQVMFNIAPLIAFGGLFYIWLQTSNVRLTIAERFYIKYFICNLLFIYSYYCLCIFSMPKWVYSHDWQVCVFVLITLIFYCLNHERK